MRYLYAIMIGIVLVTPAIVTGTGAGSGPLGDESAFWAFDAIDRDFPTAGSTRDRSASAAHAAAGAVAPVFASHQGREFYAFSAGASLRAPSSGGLGSFGSGSMAAAFWLRALPPANVAGGEILIKRTACGEPWSLGVTLVGSGHPTHPAGAVAARTGTGVNHVFTPQSVTDGTWHHVAYSRDVSRGVSEIYVDGALVSSQPSDGNSYANGAPVTIGLDPGETTGCMANRYEGDLDDVRLYGRALTMNEAAALAEPPPEMASLTVTGPTIMTASSTGAFVAHGVRFDGAAAGPFPFEWTAPDSPQVGLACHTVDGATACLSVTVVDAAEPEIEAGGETTRAWVTEEVDRAIERLESAIGSSAEAVLEAVAVAKEATITAVVDARDAVVARIDALESSLSADVAEARAALETRIAAEGEATRDVVNATADATQSVVRQEGNVTRDAVAGTERRHLEISLAQPGGTGSASQLVVNAFIALDGRPMTDADVRIRVDGRVPATGEWSRTNMGNGLYRLVVNVPGGIAAPHDVIVTGMSSDGSLDGAEYLATKASGSV